ncbi:MAG TPA: PKD domain-containing protein [Chitinophagales bacterium]|nr:PKD domain-containing protein [Chitinophagales bacterium]
MKRTTTLVFLFLFALKISSGQQIIHACCDTFVCLPGTPVSLSVTIDSGSTGTLLQYPDDIYTSVIDLGFSFTYFGNSYTQCVLSTNDYICFDLINAGQYSPWVIANAAPSPLNPLNSIYGPWHDVDPYVPPYGALSYGTFGVAPNRFFVYNFCSVPMYSCNDTLYTGQIILYETSNNIEMHLTEKRLCVNWNAGAAIQGLQDATGAVAVVVTGRNYPTQWTAFDDAIRFTPSGNTYTYATIPYAPVPFAAGTPVWNTIDGNFVGSGYNITVNPTVTTSYVVTTASCGFSSDTVTIVVGSVPATYDTVNLSCIGSNDGAVSVVPTDNAPPYTFVWTSNGDTIQVTSGSVGDTVSNLAAGTYVLVFVNSLGCTQQHIYTVTQPSYNASFGVSPGLICDGAEVTFTDFSSGNISSYSWSFGDGANSPLQNPTHTYSGTGSYTVTLTITIPPNCTATYSQTIDVHPNITGGFTMQPPPYCVGDEIQFTDASIGNPASWNWSFGDGGSSSAQNPTHTYSNEGTYTIYFSAIDQFCGTAQDSTSISVYHIPNPVLHDDTMICEGAIIYLAANDSGNAYLWTTGETTPDINYVMPGDSVVYVWVSVDYHGCKGFDTVRLRNRCVILLPAAFSPNGDGKNDLFHPLATNVVDYDFIVFNRWGQEVYANKSSDISQGWDGKVKGELQPVDVYIYYVTGHFISGKGFTLQGNVTLVR